MSTVHVVAVVFSQLSTSSSTSWTDYRFYWRAHVDYVIHCLLLYQTLLKTAR